MLNERENNLSPTEKTGTPAEKTDVLEVDGVKSGEYTEFGKSGTEGVGDAGKIADGGNITRFTYKHNPSNNPKVLADAIEDPTAIYGYRPNKEGSLKAFADGDWSNPDYVEKARQKRIAYHKRNEARTYNLISKIYSKHYSTEEIDQVVREMVEARNANRLNSYLDDKGNIIDQAGYDQAIAHCKTYEQLRAEGKSNEDIIKSAIRGNPAMDLLLDYTMITIYNIRGKSKCGR